MRRSASASRGIRSGSVPKSALAGLLMWIGWKLCSHKVFKRIFSLPMYPELTAEQIRYVTAEIKQFHS